MPAPDLVRIPAISLIVAASLGTLGHLYQIGAALWIFVVPEEVLKATAADPADTFGALDFMLGATLGVMFLPLNIMSLFTGGFVIFGAWQMSMLRNRPLAIAASIIAMIPCVSPCLCLGLPIGIWSLAVLCDENVKRSFV